MKKTLTKLICTLLVTATVLFSLIACGNNSLTDEEKAEFNVTTDYSDFGFQNMYGMNTLITISSANGENYYNFTDPENAYIVGGSRTVTFSSDTLLVEDWKKYEGNGNGVRNKNYIVSYTYSIMNNNTIAIVNRNESMSISSVEIENGIPIIECEGSIINGLCMPTGFIDWSCSPEETDDGVKYYINSSYLKNE